MRKNTGKIVLTGGPCAGKTTLTQVIAKTFPGEVFVVPEAASLLFSGGFPRFPEQEAGRAVQRAIYHVQLELEAAFRAKYADKVLVLDRGTVDGAAYWNAGAEDYFRSLGSSLEAELQRYDKVIYLESADRDTYIRNKSGNPNRTESWEEAQRLDEQTRKLWECHPNFNLVRNQKSFSQKLLDSLDAIALGLGSQPGIETK